MHNLNRILTLIVLCVALVPLGTLALLTSEERVQADRVLREALEAAGESRRERNSWKLTQKLQERVRERSVKELPVLAREKRAVRLRLANLYRIVQDLSARADRLRNDQARAGRLFEREKEKLVAFIRFLERRNLVAVLSNDAGGKDLLRRMVRGSIGERVDEDLGFRALARARKQLLALLAQAQDSAEFSAEKLRSVAGEVMEEIEPLRERHEDLMREYRTTQLALDQAERTIELSEAELQEIKEEDALVQGDILKMQGELQRIDARIRTHVERELIEKGLLGPRERDAAENSGFMWPVEGPVSAGFLNERYKKFFGIPHFGLDIVVPQGTAVRSAADGVVYVYRDGGAKKYTYVLIGHRGGYATLYGHLCEVWVQPGQDVKKGEFIGLSGGARGAPGSGPMTTGSHLHFEVIFEGRHIDPATILP